MTIVNCFFCYGVCLALAGIVNVATRLLWQGQIKLFRGPSKAREPGVPHPRSKYCKRKWYVSADARTFVWS